MSAPTPSPAARAEVALRRSGRAVGWLVALAWMVPAGVLVQAVLAGRAWFISPGLFGLHGGLGHGVLVLGLVTAALAWAVPVSRVAASLAVVAVVALVGQTGLGYAGRRSGLALASSLHVPLGVAILGLTMAVAVLVTVRWRDALSGRGEGV